MPALIAIPIQEGRARRRKMVRQQLKHRGVTNRRVLAAMAAVPREAFVPPPLRHRAYADGPLPIGRGQTISQPYMVALMTHESGVTRRSRVLEIGTGSGYQTAVLAKIARHVWTVERLATLLSAAANRLSELGISNVSFVHGDGALGHAPGAPFDAIVVTAAAPAPPPCLLDQLADGGRLVIPIGDLAGQRLFIYQRGTDGYEQRTTTACRFVPLVSPEAFDS
jgi:protein-L-isoaspartate(D-aspartate) O-methyltransferase